MTQVKICGNTNIEDAKLAASLGADYLGLIFTESKRRITPETAASIVSQMPEFKNFVAVFANQPKEEVEKTLARLPQVRILQFHGEETSRYCDAFRQKGYKIIKTFRIKDSMSLKRMDEYNADAYLFDTFSKEETGGTGKTFDWSLIKEKPFVHEKLFLAGGLNVNNLEEAVKTVHPYAVDVASGVEKEPGKKDPALLEKFIQTAKGAKTAHAQKRPLSS